ncbi:hypothetical protein [Thermus sediminis]|uniref:hypothetical protein n=1 Tax=Thermus sediminis TaxID=1761908 RepID=UPI0013003405|nr:hypothetical protein [Thermus sediminis]
MAKGFLQKLEDPLPFRSLQGSLKALEEGAFADSATLSQILQKCDGESLCEFQILQECDEKGTYENALRGALSQILQKRDDEASWRVNPWSA